MLSVMDKQGYKYTEEFGYIPEDWELKSLGNIANIQRGASPRPIDSPIWFKKDSPVGWTRIADLKGKYLYETEQKLSELGVKNSRFVEIDNLIMSICATLGRPAITKTNICIHDGFVCFYNLNTDINYTYYYLQYIQDNWKNNGQTGSQANLNTDLINNTPIPIPRIIEQEKIAKVLGDVDSLIDKTQQLINKKKDLKTATMQKLLTPKEDWKEATLGELYIFRYGEFNNNPDNGGEYPIYGANGIIGNYTRYNSESAVIIGHMGEYAGTVLWEERKHFVTYNGTISKPKNENILNSKFGYFMLKFINIPKICAGSGLPFLSYDMLNKIQVLIPKNINEQEKISTILSDMDSGIDALEKELNKYKDLKTGMMQQLLTGKVRLI